VAFGQTFLYHAGQQLLLLAVVRNLVGAHAPLNAATLHSLSASYRGFYRRNS
jgi:hypothetical protein